jgi:hypothetical protein
MVTPANPQEEPMVSVFMKVSQATAEMLDQYRISLRPVRSRAAVAREALTEYLKQQEAKAAATSPAPIKSWR